MTTIWKFPLDRAVNEISAPAGAQFLHVAEQYDGLAVWAVVDPDAAKRTRYLHVVGTGNPMPEGTTLFVGTAVTAGGSLVFHVFETFPDPEGHPA